MFFGVDYSGFSTGLPLVTANSGFDVGRGYDGYLKEQPYLVWDEQFGGVHGGVIGGGLNVGNGRMGGVPGGPGGFDSAPYVDGFKFKDLTRRKQRERSPNNVQDLYKTELCNSFTESGSCPYGANCQFAHGFEELRAVTRHPKYKTKMCRNFAEKGICPYGSRCRFIHGDEDEALLELESTEMQPYLAPMYPPRAPVPSMAALQPSFPLPAHVMPMPQAQMSLPPTPSPSPPPAIRTAASTPIISSTPSTTPLRAVTPNPVPVEAPPQTTTPPPTATTTASAMATTSTTPEETTKQQDNDLPKKRLAIFEKLAN